MSRTLRVAAFTGSAAEPAARFRLRQYVPRLASEGVAVTEYAAIFGTFPPRSQALRPLWAAATLGCRVPQIVRSRACDLTFLQREMLSTFTTLERLTRAPRVLDVDDAIWLRRGGGFARRLAQMCDLVICGNPYLADQFARWNPNVAIVPTGIDAHRFSPRRPAEEPIIGWSGTSGNLRYVYQIEPALDAALQENPEARLRIVCDSPPAFAKIPASRVEYLRWSPEREVDAIRGMAVGIMPLEDSAWTRGKCSFKMLTYMACGVPVVVSPVGMNVAVLEHGAAGVMPRTEREWREALTMLCREPARRVAMGAIGRQIIRDHYSTDVVVPELARQLLGVISGSARQGAACC